MRTICGKALGDHVLVDFWSRRVARLDLVNGDRVWLHPIHSFHVGSIYNQVHLVSLLRQVHKRLGLLPRSHEYLLCLVLHHVAVVWETVPTRVKQI
jgi:hypothetical protein